MDDRTFDHLARRFEAAASRRKSLSALAGGLIVAWSASRLDSAAKRKKKKKKCKPEPKEETCAGRCGAVKNSCKKLVACDECAVCQRCSNSGLCEPDQEGDSCGSSKVCRDGACVACGFIDAPCCAGEACVPFGITACIEGVCLGCGRDGEPCCGGRTCNGGLSCEGAGQGVCVD